MIQHTPVISMYQPWASWVALEWKTIETRTHDRFKSLVGRTIGIHASHKWDKGALDAAGPYMTYDQRRRTKQFLSIGGAVICLARVESARWLDMTDSHLALIECGLTHRFGLVLTDIRVIEAIPAKGRQGIWYLDMEVI